MTQEEYSTMLSQAHDQFKQGVPLFGKDGAFHSQGRGRVILFNVDI